MSDLEARRTEDDLPPLYEVEEEVGSEAETESQETSTEGDVEGEDLSIDIESSILEDDDEDSSGVDSDDKVFEFGEEDSVAGVEDEDKADESEASAGEDEVTESGDEDEEVEDSSGEETEESINYQRLWEEERQRNLQIQQQLMASGARQQEPTGRTSSLGYESPEILNAFAAIQSEDPDQVRAIDPQVMGRARELYTSAEKRQRELLFDPNGWIDKHVLPVVDQLFALRMKEADNRQEFKNKNAKILKNPKKVGQMKQLARRFPGATDDMLLHVLQLEDKNRELSIQRNKANGQAKHQRKIQKDNRKRITSSETPNVAPDEVFRVDPFLKDRMGEIVHRDMIDIYREMETKSK